jgi:ABC-type transport system involved in cytochrome c biogenesis permease subunit
MTLLRVTVFCFLASYLVAFVLELARFAGRTRWNRLITVGIVGAGLLAHSIYLIRRTQETGLPPLVGSAHDWLLVLAWLLVVAYLAISLVDSELAVGVFALPLVMALISATYFMTTSDQTTGLAEVGRRRWTMLHASGLALGFGGIAVAFLASLMYLVQHRRLRAGTSGVAGWRMPSLESLAGVTRWSVWLGFGFLTLGVATGIVLGLSPGSDTAVFRDPQVVLGSGVWLVLGALCARLVTRRNSSGKQVAFLAAAASGVLILAVVGMQAITGRNHSRMKAPPTSAPTDSTLAPAASATRGSA